jgi:hypothetical protein
LKAEENTSSFAAYTKYFAFANHEYHEINSSADFLSLHKDQRGLLKKYLRKEKLNFSKDPSKTLILMASYFDTISHE